MDKMVEHFRGKRVFVTGHTGFKGSWLCKVLLALGADITGYALPLVTRQALYHISGIHNNVHSVFADIRDYDTLENAVRITKPDFVFHLAAQALVIEGYKAPRETYETNIMGTVNLLEAVRKHVDNPCSVLNVTTDKVYENKEWEWGYRETDTLNGFDPYSNSKSCSELVTGCYRKMFDAGIRLSAARAGNVIGGGDFSANRIIPDCVNAAAKGEKITVRNPHSVRPYQHVLDPIFAYLQIACTQLDCPKVSGCYNIGPDERDCVTTAALVTLFCQQWGKGLSWTLENPPAARYHEARLLKLDCSRAKSVLGWAPVWGIAAAMEHTVEWYREYYSGGQPDMCMSRQIERFCADMSKGMGDTK